MDMSTINKELIFLVLQFLDEEGHEEAAHMLERESGVYFDMKFFEEMILDGNWDQAERYLSGFTKFDDNRYSTKIYFEIRKQNFLEALDKNDRARALDILMKDLKVFVPENQELFKEMTQLLALDDIREHESLSSYGDKESARKIMIIELKQIIAANPLFHDKLEFPSIKSQRLRRLINQSLNWQHIHCRNPQPNPEIRTLFVDHVCLRTDDHLFFTSSDDNQLPSQVTSMAVPTSLASLKSTPSTVSHSLISSEAFSPDALANPAGTTNCPEDANVVAQMRPSGTCDEEMSTFAHPGQCCFNIPDDLPPVTHQDQSFSDIPGDLPKSTSENSMHESCGLINNDDLPKTVARILNQDSSPTSMDFHPVQRTVLLVGTAMGEIALWKVTSGENLFLRNFKVWDIEACSMQFKTALLDDPYVSVNRIAWSPEGLSFGVAYSKHIVQIYSYHGGNDVQPHLEIDAHLGGVNDLAYSTPGGQCLVITCGDDKIIKAWDVTSGIKLYSFEGHGAPVYSLCPHRKDSIHFFFSISVDGNIKAWLYDNLGARVDYDAPGLGRTSMAYSTIDRRLFSCGTSKSGESFLAEWGESEGNIKKIYQGLQKHSLDVVEFDILKNQFLAAGDEHAIKVWDMDKVELLTTIKADGGLPANPRIRANKDGTLLAVSADENRIKILATNFGLRLLHTYESSSAVASGVLSDTFRELAIGSTSTVACAGIADEVALKDGDPKNLEVMKFKFTGKANISEGWTRFKLNKPSEYQTLWLPSDVKVNKISGLIYNNAGNAILALASNGIHLFWKWPLDALNLSGKATTNVPPKLWRPRSCLGPMTNDITGTNIEEAVPCFALSKNDSYLLSSSGGKISLFNMMTFKTMLSIMPPPPATTCLAFCPQDNNIVAIGRDNFTIIIYNVRLAKVISILEGHSQRVSGLAFSNALNVLVSSGADAQIFVWNTEGWEKQRSRFLQIPDGEKPVVLLDTHVQFHQDQTHFLAVHMTHLAIYKAKNLECVKQWLPGDFAPISQATFSCDSQIVYASFVDGTVSIFNASHLELLCHIFPTAYLPPSSSFDAYPVAIAAHPLKPNQFAVGLTDGGVVVFEPQDADGNWYELPPDENGSASDMPVESDVD